MTRQRWIGLMIGIAGLFWLAAGAFGAQITIGPLLELPGTRTMTIVWETDDACNGSVIVTDDAGFRMETPLSEKGTHHAVTVDGLRADTRYEYAVLVDGAVVYRSWFMTLPEQGPYRVIFMGDIRHNDGNTAEMFSLMDTFHPRFIVLLGDFVGRSNRIEDWQEEIFDPGKKVFDHIPVVGVPGNHDAQYDPDLTLFKRLFIRPSDAWAKSLTYTATVENDLYIFLDIYSRRPFFTFTDGFRLYRLLKDASGRSDIRHIFILSHENVISRWRLRRGYSGLKPFTRIFAECGVTAIISGHDHFYARGKTYAGTPFFITGGGGSTLYEINPYNFYSVLMGRTAYERVTHHFLVMDVGGETCTFSAVLPDGTIFDGTVLEKK